jgi:hypothetical protein
MAGSPDTMPPVVSEIPRMSYKQERQFGFLFTAVFVLIAFWPLWPLHAPKLWWLVGAGAWLLAALVYPRGLAPLRKAWMAFGHALGWVNSRIVLGVVFFVVVLPTGLVMRLRGKDLLQLKNKVGGSYWIKRDKELTPQSLRNQF